MRRYPASSGTLRVISCVAMIVLFLCSVSSANAASSAIAGAYGQWLAANVVKQEIPFVPLPVREDWSEKTLTEQELALGSPLVSDEQQFMLDRSSGFNKTVAPGEKFSTPYNQVSKGGTIEGFVAALPSDSLVEIGIQKSDQTTVQSMSFSKTCNFNFPVTSSGDYSFYIKNLSDQEITVFGEVNFN